MVADDRVLQFAVFDLHVLTTYAILPTSILPSAPGLDGYVGADCRVFDLDTFGDAHGLVHLHADAAVRVACASRFQQVAVRVEECFHLPAIVPAFDLDHFDL